MHKLSSLFRMIFVRARMVRERMLNALSLRREIRLNAGSLAAMKAVQKAFFVVLTIAL